MTDYAYSRRAASMPLLADLDGNPWLGDSDRRHDDDVEFCDESEWMDDDD